MAALDLFEERGYEGTTVSQIAARAGVTERTFYRHFADKREVLFAGSDSLVEQMLAEVRALPPSAGPSEAGRAALVGLGQRFTDELRPFSRRRQAVLEAEPCLRERELLKLARVTRALTDELVARGEEPCRAALTAELTRGVFTVTFARWSAPDERRSFAELVDDTSTQVRPLV